MKQVVLYFLLMLLSFFGFYQYLSYRRKSHKLLNIAKGQEINYRQQIEKRERIIYLMRENLDIQIQNEGRSLDSNLIVNGDDGRSYFLKDIIQDNYLVVRLGEMNCQPCVNALMTMLHERKMHRMIFLIDYENERFMNDMKKYQPQSRFFKRGLLPIPIDSLNIPYLFVLDKDLNINHLFIPDKGMLKQTVQYLENRARIL